MLAIIALVVVQQAQAYTFFEFRIANAPSNITYSARNTLTGEDYIWKEIDGETYYQLPGARNAAGDPEIEYNEPEPSTLGPWNAARLFIIDKTLEPGTPLDMCVNDNCEEEAVNKHNYAVLEVDMRTTDTQTETPNTQFYFWLPGKFLRSTPAGTVLTAEVGHNNYSWEFNGTLFSANFDDVDADDGAAHLDCCGGKGLNDWLFATGNNETIGERASLCVNVPSEKSYCGSGVVDKYGVVMGFFNNDKWLINAFNNTQH